LSLNFGSRNRVNDEPKDGYHNGPDGRMWVYVWFLSLDFVVCHLFSTLYSLLMDAISVSKSPRRSDKYWCASVHIRPFWVVAKLTSSLQRARNGIRKKREVCIEFFLLHLGCCGTQVNNERKISFDLLVSSLQKHRKKKCIDPNGQRKFCWDLVSSEILWQMCTEDTIARIHARWKFVQAAAVKIDFW
jgi:hypothetical protein